MKITSISAKKILASLGNETVEATINFEDGRSISASVPAGISTGKYEVKKSPPDQAIREIGEIGEKIKNKDWTQETLDKEVFSYEYGGNSTLAVSAAFWKATHKPLDTRNFPKLMMLLFEGGEHGNKNLVMQEFMVVEDRLIDAVRDFRTLREYLENNQIERTVGVEGGFSPITFTDNDAITTIKKALPDRKISLDMAGSFGNAPVPENVFSVEDPYDDESWDKWTSLTATNKYLVIGDDLVTTNPERIQKAIDLKAVNAVIIKPNQIGTISQTLEAVKLAKNANLKIVVSHRGEETQDFWIADFAVFVAADYVKFGGMDRGERIAKYNRLMELGMT